MLVAAKSMVLDLDFTDVKCGWQNPRRGEIKPTLLRVSYEATFLFSHSKTYVYEVRGEKFQAGVFRARGDFLRLTKRKTRSLTWQSCLASPRLTSSRLLQQSLKSKKCLVIKINKVSCI